MRELNWGKRPREEHDNVGLSENTKQQQGDNNASTGFGSGPAGRQHLRFTGTATIHLNLNIESLSKEIEQRHDIAVQRHEEQDLELRLGPPSAQLKTRDFLAQFGQTPDQILGKHQPQASQASSRRRPFGWQGQEAFHLAQPHQEIGSSSQQEVIDGQMPLVPLDSNSEPSHGRPLSFRETNHERTHHQAGSRNLVPRSFFTQLNHIPWEQAVQLPHLEGHNQAGPSRQEDAPPDHASKLEKLKQHFIANYNVLNISRDYNGQLEDQMALAKNDRNIGELVEKFIALYGPAEWQSFLAKDDVVRTYMDQTRNQLPIEKQKVFAIQQVEEAQGQQQETGPSHQGDIPEERKRKKGGMASGEGSSLRGPSAEELTKDLMKDPD